MSDFDPPSPVTINGPAPITPPGGTVTGYPVSIISPGGGIPYSGTWYKTTDTDNNSETSLNINVPPGVILVGPLNITLTEVTEEGLLCTEAADLVRDPDDGTWSYVPTSVYSCVVITLPE